MSRSVVITNREEEIATLVAQGLSNPEIAAELFVSRSTVASHIEHILAKLGFTSRTQIAVWITLSETGNKSGRPDVISGSG